MWSVVIVVATVGASLVGCSSDETSSGSGPGAETTTATACSTSGWVTSWGASPSDAAVAQDATFAPLPQRFDDQTVRNVITPHLGSSGDVRLHLTNRYNTDPVTFGQVSIGLSAPDGGAQAPVAVTFDGSQSVTAGPGDDVVSDPVRFSFDAFDALAVSLYLPSTTGQLTKHWNANATTFITPVGGGNQTDATAGDAFSDHAYSWLGIDALDVQAGPDTRALVAFGDSITDGWVSASSDPSDLDVSVADQNLRYPDLLQHRLDDAGIRLSVVNDGIGANQILVGAGPAGPPATERFDDDVTGVEGARGVIVFEGINDLGLSRAPASAIIDGLTQIVTQAKAAGLTVWLATITPASDSLLHGVAAAPDSERDRQTVNEWIRTQSDADGVIEFDAAVRDAANPAVLSTEYASPDRLHLSPTGYERLADTIDLDALAAGTC